VTVETETPFNPWISIWLSPRATVRWLIEHRPGYLVHLLIAAKIFVDGIGTAMFREMGDRLSLQAILLILGVTTPVQMILYLYVFVWFVKWAGRLLGGRATASELRTALAWASVPLLVSALLTVPELALFGHALFRSDGPDLDSGWGRASAFYGLMAADVVLALWWAVTLVVGVAEVQGFAWWKALASYLLAIAAVVAPVLAIAYVLMEWS